MRSSSRLAGGIAVVVACAGVFAGRALAGVGDPESGGKSRKFISWKVKTDLIKPANQSDARHQGYAPARVDGEEMPGFLRAGESLKSEGIVLGPNADYDAVFNPAVFVGYDPIEAKEKVFIAPRAEKDRPGSEWKKFSTQPLWASDDGRKFYAYTSDAWLGPTEPFELAGGTEDARYADLRLQPFVDVDGKSFDAAMMYTAYDGKTARIAVMFFNHRDPMDRRKKGLVFDDADVVKNPLVPGNPAWNKSMAMRQIRDPETGKIRNVYFFGEGNSHHGGILMLESDLPFSSRADGAFGLKYPKSAPVIRSRPGAFDQALVEAAHAPEVVRMPEALAKKTGEKYALSLSYHGDSKPLGYSVGYALFSLKNPGAGPIYRSTGPYLRPIAELEKSVQVDKVIFNSGMVVFKGEVLTYSGVGDSYIVLHSAPARTPDPDEPRYTFRGDCLWTLRK